MAIKIKGLYKNQYLDIRDKEIKVFENAPLEAGKALPVASFAITPL